MCKLIKEGKISLILKIHFYNIAWMKDILEKNQYEEKKIVIIGSNGQLGTDLVKVYSKKT